ncbi:MAG TPA: sulfotransferase [Dermatophilaceae bacterium]|nr:sulfotransferase [Dermatophilaceae bacterium]
MPDRSSPLQRRAVRLRAEQRLRESVRGVRAWARGVGTGDAGSLPDFLVIGGMRCGTTSLFAYLAGHPSVVPAIGKELQYFTVFHDKGERWYRGHFPPPRAGQKTFEASPYYLYHPLAPARVRELLPNGRFIALLRDPVERAYSHYKHSVERGVEPLSFLDAVHAEEERLAPYLRGGDLTSKQAHAALRSYSYVSRGMYAEQLERWYCHFDREQMLVIRSEDMYADPAAVYARCVSFLNLAPHEQGAFGLHTRAKPPMPAVTDGARDELRELYAPHDHRLRDLLGWSTGWPLASIG